MKLLFYALAAAIILGSCQQKFRDGIVINEICGKDKDGLEWIEIGNASQQDMSLKDYKLVKTDEEGIEKTIYKFPDTLLAAGSLLTVDEGELKAHIPSKKAVMIELLDAEGKVVDSFDSQQELDLEGHAKGQSYGRIPDLVGEWTLCEHATWNAPNASSSSDDEDLDFDEDED